MAQLAMIGGGLTGGGLGSVLLPLFASTVGMFLQPGQKEEQGKLNDLKVSSSAYGEGIALVYGTMRVPGNMFWATEFEEEKHYINSKGKDITGKKKDSKKGQPVYEYFGNFAMGLCAGPMGEILRVWADSNLIYDKYNPDNEDLVGPGFSQGEQDGGKLGKGSGTGKKGGSQESGRFVFRQYLGTEGQLPDPHMDEMNGTNGNQTPGHRGLVYLYFEHFALADFGNRIPTITAEVAGEHFRKPQFIFFSQLDSPPFADTSVFTNMFFDPIRYKAYTTTLNGNLRVWDLIERTETERLHIGDIAGEEVIQVENPLYNPWDGSNTYYTGQTKLFNGTAGVNYPTSGVDVSAANILGIAASGDLVCQLEGGAQNSRPIGFIDPVSWTIKNRFGEYSNSLADTSDSLQAPNRSTVLTSYDPLLKMPMYFTVVKSQYGDLYFFDDENKPMSYFTFGGSIYSGTGAGISPGLPTADGTFFYIYSPQTLFGVPAARIYRYEFMRRPGIFPTGIHDMLGDQVTPNSLRATPTKSTLIYESTPEDDESGRSMTLPYPIVGGECVGFMEVVQGNTIHPEKNGTWAVKLNYLPDRDGNYEVAWREKISSDTLDVSANEVRDSVVLTGNKLVYRKSATLVWEIDFAVEDISMYYTPDDSPGANSTQFYFPTKGCIYQESNSVPAEFGGGSSILEMYLDRNIQKEVTPAEILKDLADRVGIGAENVDVSRLNDDKITGYVVQQPRTARSVADDLMRVFFFDLVESDYTLKAVSRSQVTSSTTIYQPDLGTINGDTKADNPSDFYKETRIQEIDLPRTVQVSFIDPKEDYETGSQHWRRPRSPLETMQSRDTLDINIPMAMQDDFAKQLAQKIVYSAWGERVNYEFALPWKFLKYDPTDILTFVMDDGLTFVARMSSMDVGQDFSIRAEGVAAEIATYDSTVTAGEPGGVVPVTGYPAPYVRGSVFDIPYFEDTDSVGDAGFNYYWGVRAYSPGFRFAAMSRKVGAGGYEGMGTTPFDLVWGTVATRVTPPPDGLYVTDVDTMIKVYPAFDFNLNPGMYEWVSIDDANWPSHDNTIVIGGEIIYFKNVTANADGSYTLDTLIRGARGTGEAAYRHGTGETFTIRGGGGAFEDDIENFDYVGQEFSFRVTAPTYLPSGLPGIHQILTGASHKPWGPNDFKRVDDGADIDISWSRNTRLGGTLKDGTGTVPSVDGTEEYELYILDGPFETNLFDPDDETTYVRKFGPLSSAAVTYTAAELSADGLTQASPLYLVGYQRNQYVGRGYPGWATLLV